MDLLVVIIILFIIYFIQRRFWINKLEEIGKYSYKKVSTGFIDLIFFLHLLLFIVYFTYTQFERSDSVSYWEFTRQTGSWFFWWGTDTRFIHFLVWPFASFMQLSYASCMLIFSYLGLQGVLLFYFAAKENIRSLNGVYGNYTIIELVFLLPNLHFWSNSIGKGAVM